MIKGVIFDFDGVIADTEHVNFENLKEILSKYNYPISDKDFPDFVGRRTIPFLKLKFSSISEEIAKAISTEKRTLELGSVGKVKLIPGLKELLDFLKRSGCKIVITTGSYRTIVSKILHAYKISEYFDLIICEEDIGYSKPDPQGYTIALRKSKLAPDEAIAIEDSINGVKAGNAAGCKVVLLGNPEENPDYLCFKDHYRILDYLKQNI